MKKIVLVTKPSTLAEMYITNNKNGLTIQKDAECLKSTVNDIMAGKYDYLEAAARQSFLEKFSRYSLGAAVADALQE